MPEYATEPSEQITQSKLELEKSAIEKLFKLRVGYSEPESCGKLLKDAKAYFEENADAIREFLDDDC